MLISSGRSAILNIKETVATEMQRKGREKVYPGSTAGEERDQREVESKN